MMVLPFAGVVCFGLAYMDSQADSGEAISERQEGGSWKPPGR